MGFLIPEEDLWAIQFSESSGLEFYKDFPMHDDINFLEHLNKFIKDMGSSSPPDLGLQEFT